MGILVLDGQSVPLLKSLEVAHDLSKSLDIQGSHQLFVGSEEQFKVFHAAQGQCQAEAEANHPRGLAGAVSHCGLLLQLSS